MHHFHPKEVLLVCTEKTRYYYRHLQHILQEHTKIHGLEVHPYRIPEIVTELQTKLKELAWIPSLSPIFNLTGGTKPMLVAGYQIAQVLSTPVIYLQSEGKWTRIYTYIWENQQLRIQNEEVVPDCITLREVFDLHYGPGKWSAESPKKDDGGNFERAVAEILQKQEYEVMTNVKAADKAELHGRIGHFPAIIRLRSRPGPVTTYEVAELLNLQSIREEARKHRW